MRGLRGVSSGILLAGFLALDGFLIVAALHHAHSAAQKPVSLRASLPSSSPSSGPVASGVQAGSTAGAAGKTAPLLSVTSATRGWRASGGCTDKADMAMTTDGGKTWQPLHPPVQHVLRIDMTGTSAGWIVGAGASCTPSFLSTADAGKTWLSVSGLGQAWVVLPNGVRRPTGATTTPCGKGSASVVLAPASTTRALVVCAGRVLRTTSGGAKWSPVGSWPHGGHPVAAALVPGSSGRGVALLAGVSGCSGATVARTSDLGTHWKPGPCLAGLQPPVVVSLASGGSGFAVAGNARAQTSNAGRTWS